MQVFLFALMVALLPLRGFAGDVMATEMAIQMAAQSAVEHSQPTWQSQNVNAAKTEANHASDLGASGHIGSQHDITAAQRAATTANACAGHVTANQCHSSNAHGSCQACQACHTVALSLTSGPVQPVLVSSTCPQLVAAQFASAEAALGQKPPIS